MKSLYVTATQACFFSHFIQLDLSLQLATLCTGIFLGTSQLAYRRQKLGRSPSPAWVSGGMFPRENFETPAAIICIFVHFEGHKIALDGYILMSVANHVDCFTSNAGRPNEEIGRVKRHVLGREGVCIELESDLFQIDMAAEGRGNTIPTRALQLVPGTTKLPGDPRPTLTFFLLRNGHRHFSPPLVFLPSPF